MAQKKYDSDIIGWYTKGGKRVPIRDKKTKKQKHDDAKLNGRIEREQANDRFKEMYGRVNHTKEEEDAKETYMMYSDDMNAYLRGDYDDFEDVGAIKQIKNSMRTQTSPLSVYRGVDGAVLGISKNDSIKEIEKKLKGKTFTDKGFLSTTLSMDVAREFSKRGYDGNMEAEVPVILDINATGQKTTLINSSLSEVLMDTGIPLTFSTIREENGYIYIMAHVKP